MSQANEHRTTVSLTGTQLQNLNTTPVVMVAAIAGKSIQPVQFVAFFTHAGGTNFTVNTSLEIIIGAVAFGEATGAISGSASKTTVGLDGTMAHGTGAVNTALRVRVKTGDPTGGHASASCKVRVRYRVI